MAAAHQSEVDFFHISVRELRGKMAVGCIGFRYQDDSAGEAIEPMHDSRAQIAAAGRELLEAVEQRVHQRPFAARVLVLA